MQYPAGGYRTAGPGFDPAPGGAGFQSGGSSLFEELVNRPRSPASFRELLLRDVSPRPLPGHTIIPLSQRTPSNWPVWMRGFRYASRLNPWLTIGLAAVDLLKPQVPGAWTPQFWDGNGIWFVEKHCPKYIGPTFGDRYQFGGPPVCFTSGFLEGSPAPPTGDGPIRLHEWQWTNPVLPIVHTQRYWNRIDPAVGGDIDYRDTPAVGVISQWNPDPMSNKPGQHTTAPRAPPWGLIPDQQRNDHRSPTEQSDRGSGGLVPWPRVLGLPGFQVPADTTHIVVEPGLAPKIKPSPDTSDNLPPKTGTREKKQKMSKGLLRLFRAVGHLTEALDWLDALWWSVPQELRPDFQEFQEFFHHGVDRPTFGQGAPISMHERAEWLYHNLDKVDVEQFAKNIILMEIVDRFFGGLGKLRGAMQHDLGLPQQLRDPTRLVSSETQVFQPDVLDALVEWVDHIGIHEHF